MHDLLDLVGSTYDLVSTFEYMYSCTGNFIGICRTVGAGALSTSHIGPELHLTISA